MEKSTEQHIQPQLFETDYMEGLSNQSFLNETDDAGPGEHNLPPEFVQLIMKEMLEVK